MKVSLPTPSNAYCPQTFYTFGTYKETVPPILACSAGSVTAGTANSASWLALAAKK